MSEIWKPVPGFGNRYEASNFGNVRCMEAGVQRKRIRVLKPFQTNVGYWNVSLYVEGRRMKRGVHQMVALAFHGNVPDGKEVNHIDGDKGNNTPENLRYVTHSENLKHAHRNGLKTSRRGERHPQSVLSRDQVTEIKSVLDEGVLSPERIARLCGVSMGTIQRIKRGEIWKHVP